MSMLSAYSSIDLSHVFSLWLQLYWLIACLSLWLQLAERETAREAQRRQSYREAEKIAADMEVNVSQYTKTEMRRG